MGDDESDLKFKDQDFISNKKFFDMFLNLDNKVNEIQQTLNNGLRTTVDSNSEEIKEIKTNVESLADILNKNITENETKKESRAHIREIIAYIIAVVGNLAWILSVF